MKTFNPYLLSYSLNYILREKSKNFFITTILTFLVALLASVFFITNSLKYEMTSTLDSLPDIILQQQNAGMRTTIQESISDKLLSINGVSSATSRVWGYYYFKNAGVNFSLVGVDEFEVQSSNIISDVVAQGLDVDSMIVGEGVKALMSENYYTDYFNFLNAEGIAIQVNISGVFDSKTQLESNDMILMSKEKLKEIFDMSKTQATDIAVMVANPDEVAQVALKIQNRYPSLKLITKKDMRVSYENIFNYKSGIFLALFIVAFFTFFIIIYDKLSGLSSEQKREIGILKALGWRVGDVLVAKFYEGILISGFSYLLGMSIALLYVYVLQAPLLANVFIGYSGLKPELVLPFIMDYETFFLLFLLSVPIYIGATIIPSWRVATLDAEEVMR